MEEVASLCMEASGLHPGTLVTPTGKVEMGHLVLAAGDVLSSDVLNLPQPPTWERSQRVKSPWRGDLGTQKNVSLYQQKDTQLPSGLAPDTPHCVVM